MKKFVTTLIALLSTAAMAFTVSGCFELDPENTPDDTPDDTAEVYEQVTEEQWKTALTLFADDPDLIDPEDLNLKMNCAVDYISPDDPQTGKMEFQIDYKNKAYYEYGYEEVNKEGSMYYVWEGDDGKVYYYCKEITDGLITREIKYILNETFFEYCVSVCNGTLLGFSIDEFIDNFAEFEYNAQTGGYTYTEFYEREEEPENNSTDEREPGTGSSSVIVLGPYKSEWTDNLYFKNGKLAKTESEMISIYENGEVRATTFVTTYTYGTANVTVPNDIKNLEVSNLEIID